MGVCFGFSFLGFFSFNKKLSEVPSNCYHQRHNSGDTKWTMDLILYQKILPSIFPLLFQYLLEKSGNKSIED